MSSLGNLKDVMLTSHHAPVSMMATGQTASGKTRYKVITDSAKLLVIDERSNYVFTIAPVSPRAVTFRNLTISKKGSTVFAFLTTYTPTRRWTKNYMLGKREKFEGRIGYTPINLNDNDILAMSQKQASILTTNMSAQKQIQAGAIVNNYNCTVIPIYGPEPFKCKSGLHWPGEICALTGSDRAGYIDVVQNVTFDCSGGSEGGGGESTVTPPGSYHPCDGIGNGEDENTPGENQVPGGEIDTTMCDPPTIQELNTALDTALNNNPNILLDCETVQAFLALTSHTPPQSVYSRIDNLNNITTSSTLFSNPFYVQQIKNASGFQINLDRFEINVSTLPIIAGIRMSPTQFLNYVRLNLNDFVDNNIATFQPYSQPNSSINDAAIWNSSSPLGSILHLDMADNGSVIVSDYAWNKWTVSTLRTPVDGAHPVSGNRSWGYDLKASGGYTFYVTGSDRITRGLTDMVQLLTGVPFNAADQLWESYQTKVSAFVNNNAGSASVGDKITERPNYVALKDYFDGKITLQQLKKLKGCI